MITDLQARIAQARSLHALQQLRSQHPQDTDLRTLEQAAHDYYDSRTKLDADLLATSQDENLSEQGKATKSAELHAAWEQAAAAASRKAEAAAHKLLQAQAEPPKLTPPTTDPLLLEAQLGNARADARMYLDPADLQQLPKRMQELVERSTDPVITHLLLGTDWGEHYIRARTTPAEGRRLDHRQGQGMQTALLEWAHTRQQLTRARLSPEQAKAWDKHQALTRTIPQVINALNIATHQMTRNMPRGGGS